MEDQQRNVRLATGGCFDKVRVQESAATGNLEALVGEPDGGWGVRAIRASGNHGPLNTVKQKWRKCQDKQPQCRNNKGRISVASSHKPLCTVILKVSLKGARWSREETRLRTYSRQTGKLRLPRPST